MGSIFSLEGKVALITGGNRGIGFGMAEALGKAGADLVIWGSNPKRNAEAAERLSTVPGRVLTQVVDVSKETAVVEAMAAAVVQMGRVDSVFANAGIGGDAEPFTDATTANMRSIMGVNLDGVFWTLREACKSMVARARAGDAGGSLVGIASLGAFRGMPRAEAYSMSKGAICALMRSLAVEHGRYGIRANTIAPGFIATELNPDLDAERPRALFLSRIPAKRWGEASDFGGAAVYLASQASAYHTGDCLLIDGGYAAV
jgi:NAD(P)-dependent dehydrogenase (short-subunit alcohol dehydrogenase family)